MASYSVKQHMQMIADWILEQLKADPDSSKKIIFSDEAHFWMNGYVNKQICRIWNDANPQEVHQVAMHPQKVTVCCGLWAGGIFFKNGDEIAININGERYQSMITNFFWPKLDDMDVNDMWFQQDGALRATQLMPQWTFCTSDLRAWLSHAEAT